MHELVTYLPWLSIVLAVIAARWLVTRSRKYPAIIHMDLGWLRNLGECSVELPGGQWMPARPLPFYGRLYRWRAAWLVLTGWADALVWPEDAVKRPVKPRVRWSDNDRRFGPFIYARDRQYCPLALVLCSGDDEYPGCGLRLSAFGHTFIMELPAMIKPWRRWVDLSEQKWAQRDDIKGYWDIHRRQFGVSYHDGFLQVFFGPQTHDSSTTRSWSRHLPWTQWRHVRRSFYGLNGEHYATEIDTGKPWPRDHAAWQERWDIIKSMEDGCPSRVFFFKDYDGELMSASTRIEEREWRFGTGWFKWLSIFRRPQVRRYLEIRFSGETGKRKGSWKGGTVGHSIEMRPTHDTHESAFRRYCAEHEMTFMGEGYDAGVSEAHASDCATHDAPANDAGPCDCKGA